MTKLKQHGGARCGARRPPGEPTKFTGIAPTNDPLVFLQQVMNDGEAETRIRVAAAVALLPYAHAKKADGVKDLKQDAAKKAGAGKFAPGLSPVRLVT